MKKVLVLVLLAALVGGGVLYYWQNNAGPTVSFRTSPVKRGDLLITTSATGTVEPIEVIDVGAQVAGKIRLFGADPADPSKTVDYGTAVEEGTVLAHIDDSLYQADVAQATAQVEQAKANELRARADLVQMKAKLMEAENNWRRAKELGPSRALSATEYDAYAAAYEVAKATVAVGEATVVQIQKSVAQAEATLKRYQTNLDYCTIKSPVKGVIIDRRVNIGQTVVASLNAPSLFLIAKDLTKMQVWVAVNEADIGNIRPGQAATFTVDTYPGQVFTGRVGKIRLNASMTQNVVTYTVEINTENPDGKLLPYLTANVRFEIDRREDVLLVPNAALRWTPEPRQVAPDVSAEVMDRLQGGSVSQRGSATRPGGSAARPSGMVWVRDGAFVRPLQVNVGLTDSINTEVQGDGLREGLEVIVGELETASEDSTTNPFAPRFFRQRR